MSQEDMSAAIRKYGLYAGVRHLRNRGVPFEQAYLATFGSKPRR